MRLFGFEVRHVEPFRECEAHGCEAVLGERVRHSFVVKVPSLADVAREFNLSRGQIHQIEMSALRKIRGWAEAQEGNDV